MARHARPAPPPPPPRAPARDRGRLGPPPLARASPSASQALLAPSPPGGRPTPATTSGGAPLGAASPVPGRCARLPSSWISGDPELSPPGSA